MASLTETAESLHTEAYRLIESSQLLKLLHEKFGSSALVGGADFDLMTWRDIDVYVRAERDDLETFVEAAPAMHAALERAGYTPLRLTFNDEWARPRGSYGSGYYWGLRISDSADEVWKLDLWGWDKQTYDQKLREHQQLKEALASADRELVLRLKQEAMRLPGFRDTITSHHIYQFVLGDHGTTVEQLLAFAAHCPR